MACPHSTYMWIALPQYVYAFTQTPALRSHVLCAMCCVPAGLMLRWYLKGFLDNALRIAGVVQQQSQINAGGRAPPASVQDFQPLGQLLRQVQEGQGYTPAAPSKDLLLPSADSASKLHQALGSYESVTEASVGAAGMESGANGILSKGSSLLAETVGWWLNAAASAQLAGTVSVVDILDKVSDMLLATTPASPAQLSSKGPA